MISRLTNNVKQLQAASLVALPDLLRQWLPNGKQHGKEYIALNPNRNDRNLGSFRVCIRSGRWRDHAIGEGGNDVISLYAYLFTSADYRAAIKALATNPIVRASIVTGATLGAAKPANSAKISAAKLASIERIYNSGNKLLGSPAAQYLKNRRLKANTAWAALRASKLQYPDMGSQHALIAPFTSADGSLTGLHRTYVTPTGAKLPVASPRLTLGQVRGSAIQLSKVTDKLVICEGLEDGLTLFQELDEQMPVWVAGGASFLSAMVIPDCVTSLIIAADNDTAGERAAQHAGEAHQSGQRNVKIMRPSAPFKDFNEELQDTNHGE